MAHKKIPAELLRGPRLCAHGDVAVQSALRLISQGNAPEVTSLDFGGSALSLHTVQLIADFLLQSNTNIVNMSLRRAFMGDVGFAYLLQALLKAGSASPLRYFDVRANRLTKTSGTLLAAALVDSEKDGLSALKRIDMSNNNLTHVGLAAVEKAVSMRGGPTPSLELRADGNLVLVEVLNGITHGLGVVFALVAGTLLVYRSALVLPLYQTLAMFTFAVSLCTMFLSSCLYHSFFRIPSAHSVFHKADHCAIFVLIAGSYTPFTACYALDPPTVAGPVVLSLVWLCAVVGILMAVGAVKASRSQRAMFALATGWIGIVPAKLMISRMSTSGLWLVLGGGLAYSFGSIFYLAGKHTPFLHVVWHLAVMLAAALHMLALWGHILAVEKAL